MHDDFVNASKKNKNVEIHKIEYKSFPLYFVHIYSINDFTQRIEQGDVYIVYEDPAMEGEFCAFEKPVLNYRYVCTVDGKKYVELCNMFIEEAYRKKGLGSLSLKYFESKIVQKYFFDSQYIKGVLLIGAENKLRRFYRRNGFEINGSNIRKKIVIHLINN